MNTVNEKDLKFKEAALGKVMPLIKATHNHQIDVSRLHRPLKNSSAVYFFCSGCGLLHELPRSSALELKAIIEAVNEKEITKDFEGYYFTSKSCYACDSHECEVVLQPIPPMPPNHN